MGIQDNHADSGLPAPTGLGIEEQNRLIWLLKEHLGIDSPSDRAEGIGYALYSLTCYYDSIFSEYLPKVRDAMAQIPVNAKEVNEAVFELELELKELHDHFHDAGIALGDP